MPRPDPDEKFSLHPEEPESVLRKLLGTEEGEEAAQEEPEEEPTED
jgi:hypothetical protein